MRKKSLFTFYFTFSQCILISFAQQIPLVSNNEQQSVLGFSPKQTQLTQYKQTQTNTKIFKLKHVLHHGVTPSTKHLFRQLNIDDIEKDYFTVNFNEHVINSIVIDSSREIEEINGENRYHIREVPNSKDKTTVLSMAKMSYDAYIELESLKDHWIDLGDWNVSIIKYTLNIKIILISLLFIEITIWMGK
jgi:putative lipase involved disintegration of autophagic bodies